MTDKGLSFSECSYIDAAEFEKARKVAACPESGAVLFSKDGTVGKVHVVRHERPFAALSSIAILRPDVRRLDSNYLGFALGNLAILKDAINRKTGSALQRIILTDLKEISIPLPDLSEQRQIAAGLERANRLRRTRRYALELTETILSAAFLEFFGKTHDRFPALTVDKLARDKPNAIRTGPFGSQLLHSEFTDSGIAVLGIDNAVNNEFVWDQRRFITPEKYQHLKRYTVFPGDVIITIMGTCGRCAIVPNDITTAINTKHLCCITLDHDRCLPVYLHGAFLFHPFVRHQLAIATKGAIMDGLNMEIIKGLRIPLPPLPLQQKFADLAERADCLRAIQREALRQAEHLFASVLAGAFSDSA
jgi:type I restriction enzyme S subunit